MKRIITLVLCAALLLSALACGVSEREDERPLVVCTIFPQYDFVRQIAGDRVNAVMLCKPGSEVHGFDPSLQEMAMILNSDLLIYVGGETDEWVADLLETNGRHLSAVALIDLVDTVDEERKEGMQGKAEDEPEADEHVWTSPENAIRIVNGLCDALWRTRCGQTRPRTFRSLRRSTRTIAPSCAARNGTPSCSRSGSRSGISATNSGSTTTQRFRAARQTRRSRFPRCRF